MARLRHVDSDLVRATGLQLAFNQRVGIAKVLDRLDVRDGILALLDC